MPGEMRSDVACKNTRNHDGAVRDTRDRFHGCGDDFSTLLSYCAMLSRAADLGV